MTDKTCRYRKTVGLSCSIEVAQERPALNPCRLALGVHDNAVEQAQVDDQTFIAGGMTRKAVRTATNRDL